MHWSLVVSLHKGPIMRTTIPYHDTIMCYSISDPITVPGFYYGADYSDNPYIIHQPALWQSIDIVIWRTVKESITDSNQMNYNLNNVMTWKHYSALLALFGGNPVVIGVLSSQRASDVGLWCFLGCYLEQATGQTVELAWIWYVMSLMWRHCTFMWRHCNAQSQWLKYVQSPWCAEWRYICPISLKT